MNEKDTIKIRNIYNKYRWKAVLPYVLFVLCCFLGFAHSIFQVYKFVPSEYIVLSFWFIFVPMLLGVKILSDTWDMIKIIKDGKTETEQKVPEEES